MTRKISKPLLTIVSLSVLSACATQQAPAPMATDANVQQQLEALEVQRQELDQRAEALANQESALKAKELGLNETDLLPPDAQSGECYARVWVEPKFKTVSETLLVKEESEKVHTTPAQYETVTEQVLVKQADYEMETIPATYKTLTEQKLVSETKLLWKTDLARNAAPASKELLDAASNGGIDLTAATPGMCFHEHFIPAEYTFEEESVLVKGAYDVVSVSEPDYRWVEKKVLVKEASTELRAVPAEYETVTEQVVDVAAHTVWKKGTGPIQKIDEATGEIMCLVEVPATYKTISKRVLKSPVRTEQVTIPAEYKMVKVKELVSGPQEIRSEVPAIYETVKVEKKLSDTAFVWHEVHNLEHPKQTRTGNKVCLTEHPAVYETVTTTVVDTPATTRRIDIPAVYKTVEVTKLVKDAQETREVIPAEYTTVVSEELESEGFMEWRSILCKTNMTTSTVSDIQRALLQREYNPGPIDGAIGVETMDAVNAFQRDNGLPTDKYINMETIKALGVNL